MTTVLFYYDESVQGIAAPGQVAHKGGGLPSSGLLKSENITQRPGGGGQVGRSKFSKQMRISIISNNYMKNEFDRDVTLSEFFSYEKNVTNWSQLIIKIVFVFPQFTKL